MSDDATSNRAFGAKDAAIFFPIVGSAIAMCWELGSFLPIGGHSFEQFSLTEHILFALPALPPALFFALGCITGILWKITDEKALKRTAAGVGSFSWRIQTPIYLCIAIIFFCAFYLDYIALAVGALILLAVDSLVTFRKPPPDEALSFMVVLLVLGTLGAGMALAYTLGADVTRHTLNSIDGLSRITLDHEIKTVRVIRTGDRGTLIYEPKPQTFVFLAKDAVKEIDWPRPSSSWRDIGGLPR